MEKTDIDAVSESPPEKPWSFSGGACLCKNYTIRDITGNYCAALEILLLLYYHNLLIVVKIRVFYAFIIRWDLPDMKNDKKHNPRTPGSLFKTILKPGIWRKITSVLLACVVFLTTYMMILPALTIDLDTADKEPGMDVAMAEGNFDQLASGDVNRIPPSVGKPQTGIIDELLESADALSGSSALVREEAEAISLETETASGNGATENAEISESEIQADDPSEDMLDDSLFLLDGFEGEQPEGYGESVEEFGEELMEGSADIPEEVDDELSEGFGDNPEGTDGLPADEQESNGDATEPAESVIDSAEMPEDAAEETEEEENIAEESVFAHVLKAEGEGYRVTVSYTDEAEIPEGAELLVTEILSGESDYDKYVSEAADTLSTEKRIMSVDNARFFDITIINGEDIVEPKVPVTVFVELADNFVVEEDAAVIHYTEDEAKLVETVDPEKAAASIEEAKAAEAAAAETAAAEIAAADTAVTSSDYTESDTLTSGDSILIADAESVNADEAEVEFGTEETMSQELSAEMISDSDASATVDTSGSEETNEQITEEVSSVWIETPDEEVPLVGAEHIDAEMPPEENEPAEETEELVLDASMNPIAFVADSLPVYGFVTATLEKTVLASDGHNYKVTVTCGPDAGIPEDAELSVEEITQEAPDYVDYVANVENVLDNGEKSIEDVRLFDIKIVSGEDASMKYQPAEGSSVNVRIELADTENRGLSVVHFEEDAEAEIEGEVLDAAAEDGEEGTAVEFETDGFSVFAVAYTVDFHYEVAGKEFEFSIPGGGFVSLEHLVEILGISENAKKFVANVENVEFSDPNLVWAGKVDEATTVGEIKESKVPEVEYSAELTEEQIAEINAQPVEAGDWALISRQPFTSEETLTVTMKNGEQFIIRVTDGQIIKNFITAEGDTYRVTVNYDENAEIPNGAELEVSEIRDDEACRNYALRAQSLLDASSFSFLRIFDISILFEGEKVEPAADVRVTIEYVDGIQPEETGEVSIIHFAEESSEILSASTDTNSEGIMEVNFSTDSFSPFATVSERINNSSITDSVIAFFNFDEINENGGFTSTVNGVTSYAMPFVNGATPDLSPAFDGNVLVLNNSNDDALKVTKSDGNLMSGLTQATISYWAYTTDDGSSWAYYAAPNELPQQNPNEYYIGAFHKNGQVQEERYYNGRGNGNYSISGAAGTKAWHYVTVVYGTNTTTLYVDGVQQGNTKYNQPALNNILGNTGVFQIGRANWGSGEFFSGYLDEMMIMNRALTAEEFASLYNSGYAQGAAPKKQDKIDITSLINYALTNGIDTVTEEGASVPAGSYRTTLPGKVLNDVIFFATEYNLGEYNYDYYAVTHDGGLAKVTDLGSEIMWKDPRDIKWDLIVYTNTVPVEDGPDLIVPSGYYELAYTDEDGNTHYLVPQLNTSSLVQGNPVGLQFAGPAAGTHGTTIEAWDANNIEYAGIQIQHEKLIAVDGQGAEEFFFARNTEPVSYTEPRPVATVDSASKGIQISLFDYNGTENAKRPVWMETLIGDGPYRSGHQVTVDLVKHNLDNGIPVASLTNTTLTELFGDNTSHVDSIYNNVNHLFLQGTYDETGYFSYNSAQNYAYYNTNDGNFIVYDQAAAPNGTGTANYHGNFFPYNTYGEASTSQYMWYDVNDTLLTPDDPEYGTALRSLDNINYSFGMEMATDFYITRTGHDARGRDIVYEFNGDDDLWVFVDDKLALDIGGVHGAIHGTINFTTGEIIVASERLYSVTGETSAKNTEVLGSIRTTLAEQFRLAYKEQGKTDA